MPATAEYRFHHEASVDPGEVSDLPTVLWFGTASFVLTVFGRYDAVTARGDPLARRRYLNLFFRI